MLTNDNQRFLENGLARKLPDNSHDNKRSGKRKSKFFENLIVNSHLNVVIMVFRLEVLTSVALPIVATDSFFSICTWLEECFISR